MSSTEVTTKKATLYDVARLAGTSPGTASRALRSQGYVADKTREAVLKAVRELDFEANPHAQRLRTGGAQKSICLFAADLDLGVGTSKIKFIQAMLAQRGYDVPIYSHWFCGDGDAKKQQEHMHRLCLQGPTAIISFTSFLQPEALKELEEYAEAGGIVVCYDEDVDVRCDRVVYDHGEHSYRTARYLLELGHREIGLYVNALEAPVVGELGPTRGNRFAGFCRAMAEFGVAPRQEWIFHGLYEEGGRAAAAQFLSMKQRPTAMCVVNDNAALAFIGEMCNAGVRVPEDVSVIGHDDLPMARYAAVPLTAMCYPSEQIAEKVVSLVMDRLEGKYKGSPRCLEASGEIIVRKSTAPPMSTE